MTPESQMRAIAKAIGLPEIHNIVGRGWVCGWKDGFRATEMKVPDYLNDLNASREMVKTMCKDEQGELVDCLADTVIGGSDYLPAYFATAAQIAEAFLRVKGLWVDEQ